MNRIRKLRGPRPSAFDALLEQCSFYAGDYRVALKTSRHAIQNNPRNPDALFWQAKSAEQLSASSFAQMHAAAPDSPKTHLLMAELHRAREEFPAAEEEYNKVLNTAGPGGEKINAHLGLAYIYLHNSEDDRSLEQLQDVLTTDPSNADANFMAAQIFVRRHQYDEATPHLRHAMTGLSAESLPEAHSLLAKCYAARGEYAQALQELKPALSDDPMGVFHYQIFQLYQKLGDTKAAEKALQQSEELRRGKAKAEQQHLQSTKKLPAAQN